MPVLSCSQLLKITGFKNTIYNVLALDRCSTCVTVLIYKTKMVTVNYVFLCAFLKKNKQKTKKRQKKKKSVEKVVGTWKQLMFMSEKGKLFFFWWSIMETECVSEKEKKMEKAKKIYEYIFFS